MPWCTQRALLCTYEGVSALIGHAALARSGLGLLEHRVRQRMTVFRADGQLGAARTPAEFTHAYWHGCGRVAGYSCILEKGNLRSSECPEIMQEGDRGSSLASHCGLHHDKTQETAMVELSHNVFTATSIDRSHVLSPPGALSKHATCRYRSAVPEYLT